MLKIEKKSSIYPTFCILFHVEMYICIPVETMKSFLILTLAAVLLASCSAQWRGGPFIIGRFGGDDGFFDDGFFDDGFFDDDFFDDDFYDDDSFGFFLGGPRMRGFGMGGVSPFVGGMSAGGLMSAGVGGIMGAGVSGFGGMGGMIGGHMGGSGYGKTSYGGYGKKMSGYGKKMTGYGKSSAIAVPMVSGKQI